MADATFDAKLGRAELHLKHLREANTRLMAANGGSWPGEIDLRPGETARVGQLLVQPDSEWSLIIGDCIQNLRAALDHCVWRLTPAETRNIRPNVPEFPIFLAPEGYSRERRRRIGSIAPAAAAIIDQVQPFTSTEPNNHPLWLLHELARIDRHREIHVTTMAIGAGAVDAGGQIRLGDLRPGLPARGTVASVTYAAHPEPSKVPSLRVVVDVFFMETGVISNHRVIPTLTTIAQHVRAILDELHPFISS